MYEAKLLAGEGLRKRDEQRGNSPFNIDSKVYSSVTKLMKVSALAMKFIEMLKRKSTNRQITTDDIERAEQLWVYHVQRKHFSDVYQSIQNDKQNNLKSQLGICIDNNGLLQCRGRLENAGISEEAKTPLLMPKDDTLTQLLI